MNRKHFPIALLFSIVLLGAAFIPLSSQQRVKDYDPWYDMHA